MAKKRHHTSKKHLKGAAYLRAHDEKRGPHGEFEDLHGSRKHHGPMPRYSAKHPEHHSSHPENHSGREMDPWEYKDHMRGQEIAEQRKARMMGYHDMYSGIEARRHQEMQDAGMIHENPSAIANMPQEVMIKPYPRTGPYMPEVLDDTIAGVDRQMDYDDFKRADSFYPKKV